uniref:Uncharacterized protein n=1 Tax=Balaenoptera musculus TaxID=9771 RepID=A0A8C0DF68_BALMU
MMKLRLPTRPLLNCTNPNRPIPSNTLYTRHNNRLLISHTYLPRRKLWLSYSVLTCKRSLHILHLPLPKHDIPTFQPTLILNVSSRLTNPNVDRRPTRRTPLCNCRPTRIHPLLPLNSSVNTSN